MENQRPVLVWSGDSYQLQLAHDECVQAGYLVSEVLGLGSGYCSFHIHTTETLSDYFKAWLAKGVCWIQVRVTPNQDPSKGISRGLGNFQRFDQDGKRIE